MEKLGRYDEALESYERAIALRPASAPTRFNRGNVLSTLGRLDEALESYDHAIAIQPDDAKIHYNRGNTLKKLGRHDQALAAYDRAIAIEPTFATAYFNRALTLVELDRYAEALPDYERAIALKPDYADAHHNRGVALRALLRPVEALASYERAIALDPKHASAHFGSADLQLALGHYEAGFRSYEWRWRAERKAHRFTQPQWLGESIADKTILLHAEQGLGDSLQMLRYLPLVKAKARRVILELPSTIRPLLERMAEGVEIIERCSQLPSFDVHCPLMSLPLAFGTRLDTIPAEIPYLTIPGERLPMWRARLPKSTKPRVGIVWSGSSLHPNDRNRNIPIDRLAPLLHLKDISFVSLQREHRDQDLPVLAGLPIERIDDAIRDFGDTAAAIEQCDLVIAVDTAVAHLAGSLGKPLWLLLPYVPDWRWLLDRTDSPWYPTARLFRQTKIADWESVIAAVVNELSAFSEEFADAEKMPAVADRSP